MRHTLSLLLLAVFLLAGCGSSSKKYIGKTIPGNKVSVAGMTVEVRPGGEDISTSRAIDEDAEHMILCGEVMVEIAGMRLFVSMGPKPSGPPTRNQRESLKDYGEIAKGDSILIDDGAVFVNGEKRTANNE